MLNAAKTAANFDKKILTKVFFEKYLKEKW